MNQHLPTRVTQLPIAETVEDLEVFGLKDGRTHRLRPGGFQAYVNDETARRVEAGVAPFLDLIAGKANDDDLGSAAHEDVTAFATAAQGSSADTALQPTTGVVRLPTFDYASIASGLAGVQRVFVEDRRAHFARVDSEPPHGVKFQNGVWWSLDELTVTPFMAGAAGDGVTDDTAAVTAIVGFAYLLGATIYWPDAAFLTTESIPNFHDVKHTGPGRVLRGSDVWYSTPTGSQRNIVYYDTTGDNANDGLSAAAPRLTLSNAVILLNKYGCEGKMLDGRWRLQFAAGTWLNQTIRISSALKSRYRIELHGVLDENGTPLTIWEHTNTSILNVVHIEPEGQYEFRNIHAKGVDNTQFASYGFIGKSKVDFWFADCRATGKSIGFAVINQSEGYFERCWAISCFDGFRGTYSSTISVGLLPEAACRALECTNAGAFVSRTSVGHVDYFNPEDCGYGVLIDMNARTAITGGNFKRCAVGVQTWGGGEWADGGVPINFNVGTADACLVTYRSQGTGGEARLYSQNSQSYHRIGHGLGPWTTDATSQTTLTNVVSPPAGGRPRLVGGFFADSGKALRVRAWGQLTGAGINKTLRLLAMDYDTQANPAQLMNINLGSGEGGFDIDCLIVATGIASQSHARRLTTPTSTGAFEATTSVSFAADRMLRFYGLLGASGGQISLSGYEIYLAG